MSFCSWLAWDNLYMYAFFISLPFLDCNQVSDMGSLRLCLQHLTAFDAVWARQFNLMLIQNQCAGHFLPISQQHAAAGLVLIKARWRALLFLICDKAINSLLGEFLRSHFIPSFYLQNKQHGALWLMTDAGFNWYNKKYVNDCATIFCHI